MLFTTRPVEQALQHFYTQRLIDTSIGFPKLSETGYHSRKRAALAKLSAEPKWHSPSRTRSAIAQPKSIITHPYDSPCLKSSGYLTPLTTVGGQEELDQLISIITNLHKEN